MYAIRSYYASLAELEFKKGDRVAIYMKNSLEFVVAFYALQKLGVIAVWVNAIYRMHDRITSYNVCYTKLLREKHVAT